MLVAILATPPAGASVQESSVQSQILGVRQTLSVLAGQIERAEQDFQEAHQRIAHHERDLEQANKELEPLRGAFGRRAAKLYVMGSSGFLETVLVTEDISVLTDRLNYLDQVAAGERGTIERLTAVRRRARTERRALDRALSDAEAARGTLTSRRARLDTQLADYQRLLDFMKGQRAGFPRASRGVSGGFLCPVGGPSAIASNYGAPRPGGAHAGVDLSARYGTPVVAVLAGQIVQMPSGGWWGYGIILRDRIGNEWWYAHLSSRNVTVGEAVGAGQPIGNVGCSGSCSGPHLHFEYHPGGGGPADPYRILAQAC